MDAELQKITAWTEAHTQQFATLLESSADPIVERYRRRVVAALRERLKTYAEGTIGAQLLARLARPVLTLATAELTLIMVQDQVQHVVG